MSTAIDLRAVHLLASRLCHDLVGPVGAINNGLELAGESSGGMDAEVMDLVSGSARQVSERLQFFRVAIGLASGAVRTAGQAHALLRPSVVGEKNTFRWDYQPGNDALPLSDQGVKVLLNLVMMAGEALPRGGDLSLTLVTDAGRSKLHISATGTGALLDDETVQALTNSVAVDSLTPRTAQAYLVARLAEAEDGTVQIRRESEDAIILEADLEAVG